MEEKNTEKIFDIEELQMQEDDGLSDLRLGEVDDEQSSKKRRVLIISAGLLIIFLVMLVATKAFNGGGDESEKGYLLPPEPVVENSSKSLFEPVNVEPVKEPSVKNDREEFSKIIEDLKKKELDTTTQKKPSVPEEKVVNNKIEEVVQPSVTKTNPKKEVVKEVKAPKVMYPKGKYFVQVGATSRAKPDKVFLKKLTDNSLTYAMRQVAVGNRVVNKILVGPYPTKASALKELPSIRRYITSDAFIYKAR